MDTLPQWPPELNYWLLLTLTLAAERLLPLPRLSHPFAILQRLAQGMARKVHRPGNSRSQQRISGLMACLSLTLPWLAIAATLYWISELNWLFEAIVLFLCLHSRQAVQDYKVILGAVAKGQKQLARERLAPYLARDTQPLSELGIRKAAMEAISRYLMLGWFGSLFWFALAGPLAALLYRMVLELAYAWPVIQRPWRDFGFAANALARGFAWPATIWIYLLLAARQLLGGKILPWRFAAQASMHLQDGRLWRALAMRLGCRLGGPIKLSGTRQHRPRFDYGPEPQLSHAKQLGHSMLRLQIVTWLLLSPVYLVSVALATTF